jgi:NDP-sugar pyrophosphorylase family protein
MRKKLLIIGAGQHAKITIENVLEQDIYDIIGMVCFKAEEKKNIFFGVKVVCDYHEIRNYLKKIKNKNSQIFFIIGIGTLKGNMKIREKIYKEAQVLLKPANIINPKSHVSKFAKIGSGNLIEAFAKISAGAKIGNNCVIESFSAVNHDQLIGNNVFISTNVALAGEKIGSNTLICDGVTIGFKKSVGSNCIILDGTIIKKDIRANSLCYENSNLKILPVKKYIKTLKKNEI